MRISRVVVLIGALSAGLVVSAIAQPPLPPVEYRPRNGTIHTVGLFDWLFNGSQKTAPSQSPSPEGTAPPRNDRRQSPRSGVTYRTLCVRLCDGFFFPISFAATRSKFADDAARCEQQCPSRSRLFVYRNPGEEVEDMVEPQGRPVYEAARGFSLPDQLRGRLHLSWQPLGSGKRLPAMRPMGPASTPSCQCTHAGRETKISRAATPQSPDL